jgi:non-specific serine/threonine protein kinase
MVLQCSLGRAVIYTKGMNDEAKAALTRGLALAQKLEDFDYQQRANADLWLFLSRSAKVNEALAFARRYEEIARGRDVQSRATADWFVGISLTYAAAHVEATERLQRASDHYPIERRGRDLVRFGSDLRASAAGHLAVNLLSRGLLDAASRSAMAAIGEARDTNHATVLCIALAWAAGFIFLSLDELDLAERYGEELIEHAFKHSMRPFHAAGLCIRGSLAAKRGDPAAAVGPLRAGLAEMHETAYLLFYPFFLAELAIALAATGRVDDGLAEIDRALDVALEIDYRWFVPEILRIKGELLALRGSDDPATIDAIFHQSMNQARDQQALYWELRAATSMAESMSGQGRNAEARALLAPIYARLTEGFSASRVKQARSLLDLLQ